MEDNPVQVLLADDHARVREGLRDLVDSQEDMKVIGEAANGLEAVHLTRILHPDVVVMDFNMPHMNGIEATRQIVQELPGIAIIGLSLYDDHELAQSMIEAGARAFVTKGGSNEELYNAIRATREQRA